jgi:hypothetical protein
MDGFVMDVDADCEPRLCLRRLRPAARQTRAEAVYSDRGCRETIARPDEGFRRSPVDEEAGVSCAIGSCLRWTRRGRADWCQRDACLLGTLRKSRRF